MVQYSSYIQLSIIYENHKEYYSNMSSSRFNFLSYFCIGWKAIIKCIEVTHLSKLID